VLKEHAGKAPAFQFYAAEWLADETVQLMTLEEEGAYIHLVAYCWREGSIPADLDLLSRLCKGASTTVLTVVTRCFQPHPDEGSRLVHKRLEEERMKQKEWRDKSSDGGKKSALKRWGGPVDTSVTVVKRPLQPNGNSLSLSSPSSLKKGPRDAQPFVLPDWIDREAWDGYEEMRAAMRKKPTDRARTLIVEKLALMKGKGHDTAAILRRSTMSNWTDVYEPTNAVGQHSTASVPTIRFADPEAMNAR
jgi:uncharacterized protein YdaU (DUF1376 family)